MSDSKKTSQKWIEAAYREFARSGPDFSLKALAKQTKLPRASFYYHFDSKENLIGELLKMHQKQIKKYLSELKTNVKSLIPDLYEVMFKYKEGILFHHQLMKNSQKKEYNLLYRSSNEISFKILLPLIKNHFGEGKSDLEIIQFYHTLTDAWYARLDTINLDVDSMIKLAKEILENTLGLYAGTKNQDQER